MWGTKRREVRGFNGRNPETGAVRHVTRTTTGGIKAATQLSAKLETQVANGYHGANCGTFGELLDDWLRDGKQGRSPTTLDGCRINIESTIKPALGNIPLLALRTHDLDRLYRRLSEGGTSDAMIVHHHRVIRAGLRQGGEVGQVAAQAQAPRSTNRL